MGKWVSERLIQISSCWSRLPAETFRRVLLIGVWRLFFLSWLLVRYQVDEAVKDLNIFHFGLRVIFSYLLVLKMRARVSAQSAFCYFNGWFFRLFSWPWFSVFGRLLWRLHKVEKEVFGEIKSLVFKTHSISMDLSWRLVVQKRFSLFWSQFGFKNFKDWRHIRLWKWQINPILCPTS